MNALAEPLPADPAPIPDHGAPDYAAMRAAMVSSQLRTSAVNDPRVVAAMALVPRERYVPAEHRSLAYRDTAVPLGGGRYLNTPIATGRLLTEAYLRPSDRVLLVGAASGYAAAVLADLVAEVVAVETDAHLLDLAPAGGRAELVSGAMAEGAPGRGPFDVLMVDGAVEELPATLMEQLAPDARVVAGLVDRGVTRLAAGRAGPAGYGLQPFADLDCVVLPGFARPRGFRF